MDQLTLRGFDKRLEHCIRQVAGREHISLNKAALKLIRQGAGQDTNAPPMNTIGNQLDDFIGSWNEAQALEFEQEISVFEEIDEEQWR